MYYILYIFFTIILFNIVITFLNVSSKMNTTLKNVDFITDIYEICTDNYKEKINRLIDWHKIYHHPFLVERSYKYHKSTKTVNNYRFAIFIDLGGFILDNGMINEKKWLDFSEIIKMPLEIEKSCIDYMITSKDQVDFIWGLDPLEGKEKIYLEFPKSGKIESYIIHEHTIADSYEYIKNKTNSIRLNFMYTRINSNKEKDSYHFALKNPIRIENYKIYIISYSPLGNSITYYYRCL
jgi:hypothetical protein